MRCLSRCELGRRVKKLRDDGAAAAADDDDDGDGNDDNDNDDDANANDDDDDGPELLGGFLGASEATWIDG